MKTLKDIAILLGVLVIFVGIIALIGLQLAGDIARSITWIKWALA